MKTLFKWLFRFVVLLVILLVAAVLLKDTVARAVAEKQIRSETGLEAKIGQLQVGLLSPVVTIENFKLYNAPEFGGSVFIDLPELHVEYDPTALASRKLHLKLVRFNLAEVNVVQNKDGKTNVEDLKARQKQKASTTSETPMEFTGIDTLNLSIGKVKFTSLKQPAANREIELGVSNEIVNNVKSEKDLEPLIARIAVQKGAPLLLESLLGKPTDLLKGTGKDLGKEAQKLFDGLTAPRKK